jgi:tRNA-modifying protein YgfZ
MSNEWSDMLNSYGLGPESESKVANERIVSAIADVPQLVDMSALAVIDVDGDDAFAFLQGQFCNDLAEVSPQHAQITGYCTPKGRLLALPLIAGTHTGYRLILPLPLAESFIKRLRMFILRSKVRVEKRDDLSVTGVFAGSDGALEPFGARLGALPAAALDAETSDSQQLIRWHDAHFPSQRARYLLIAGPERQIDLWQSSSSAQRAGRAIWRLADINAGMPTIDEGSIDVFVPQMLNLQVVKGLSFTKGCYPGQEIVARMQYLGKLKRHMRLFRMALGEHSGNTLPTAGDALVSGDDEGAGIVVDAVRVADESVDLLAVVKVSAEENSFSFDGATLTVLDLPYQLPSLADPAAAAG